MTVVVLMMFAFLLGIGAGLSGSRRRTRWREPAARAEIVSVTFEPRMEDPMFIIRDAEGKACTPDQTALVRFRFKTATNKPATVDPDDPEMPLTVELTEGDASAEIVSKSPDEVAVRFTPSAERTAGTSKFTMRVDRQHGDGESELLHMIEFPVEHELAESVETVDVAFEPRD